jgi:hypothetical protein
VTHSAENDAGLTEAEREVLSGLCDVGAPRGPGHDAYCYAHHAPVKWAGRANADEVCCVDVEDYVEQVLELRATRPIPPGMPE